MAFFRVKNFLVDQLYKFIALTNKNVLVRFVHVSLIAGTKPLGLIFKNSGCLCSPLLQSKSFSVKGIFRARQSWWMARAGGEMGSRYSSSGIFRVIYS